MPQDHDSAHVILLVFEAISTDQESSCQATHGRDAKNVVVLVLREVQFFIIFPL
jgi:hypothetical protein